MLSFLVSPSFWASVLASTTPVLLATLAANIMTKAGIFNLGIEGTMLICALGGVLASGFTGSLFIGMLVGVLLGILVSFVLGYFILVMNAPMNSCGVAINLAATGGTVFILAMVCGSKNNSSSLVSAYFPNVAIPLLKDIPVVGQILSGQNAVTYLSWIFVAATYFLLYHTKLGLNIRAVGENEAAAKSAGINVLRIKFIALAMCGLFCAFGGMYLSMGALHGFTAGMVSGRGFLSLAMDAIAQGNPLIGCASSFLYGFSNTITVYLQLYSQLDLQLISAFPYVFILVVLMFIQLGRSRIEKKKQRAQF
ncbi:MAG: ABC transporter permease [Lachnospiraceae bacterium]|nr:ABC transporter permease [Lachnospiraceae bacterium]